METLREKFKEFVLSEKNTLDLNILVDEFDFTIPDYVENFYNEVFRNEETRRFEDGYVRLILEVSIEKREFIFFNALFSIPTFKELRCEFSRNYKKKIQELSCPFNIFFTFTRSTRNKEDLFYLRKMYNKYKFGLINLYDDALFFPIEDFTFSYEDMRVL